MKKIALIIFLFCIVFLGSLSAQSLNLKVYTSPLYNSIDNYSGRAVAVYLQEDEIGGIKKILQEHGRYINKLSKNNSWLCWQALREWEYKDGETYLIILTDEIYPTTLFEKYIAIIATIEDNEKTFSWWGVSDVPELILK